ncbi:MAG: TerB family tellurite resistance protein [Bernardetiaceae bacterium]|nr:TerB family tellurite resistance protein [Bernardetiaceae bacterium]
MKPIEFKKILFKGAFTVAACDGDIDETEIAALKEMMQHSLYFEGLDYDVEIHNAFRDIKTNGEKAVQGFFASLQNMTLTELQEFQLLEVLIKLIEADGHIAENELHFLYNVKISLKHVTEAKIVSKLPKSLNLLLQTSQFANYSLNLDTESIKLSDLNK